MMIGCDFHPGFQQIAYVEQETASAPREQRTDNAQHIPHRSCSLADRFVEIGHHEIATSLEYELPPFNS
jgi:hypothetical protein